MIELERALNMNTAKIQSEIWLAFSTLSDAQECIHMGSYESANDMINHAKLHIMEIMETWSDKEKSDAMMTSSNKCNLPKELPMETN